MAFSTPAVVTQVTGRAWIRNSDGSLTELHVGSKISPDTEIVTASGATVALQTEGGMPLTIGENRDVAFNAEMAGQPVDASEAAVAPPAGTDSDRLLAALQNGQDPFDNLDPTAATLVSGGGDGGGSSFVRLARIVESTTPLDLAYPNSGVGALNLQASAGVATTDQTAPNNAPTAADDTATGTERSTVSGNILTNDTDPDGDALAIVSVGGQQMVTGGVTVTGSNGGTFTVFPDGSYTFNPGDGFHNLGAGQSTTSSTTYTVTDPSGATSTATVTVTVNGLNDAPTGTAIDGMTGVDAQKVDVDLSSHFSDIDNGDKLTYTATGLPPGLTIDPNTGVITGTIDHSASQGGDKGVYTIVVTATDTSGASVSEQFNWNVTNPAPTAADDANATQQGGTVTGNVINGDASGAGKDVDPDGDTLKVQSVNGQDGNVGQVVAGDHGGTFTINADGSYTFNAGHDFDTLAVGKTAVSSITYTVTDSEGGTSTATLAVTVTGTNDAPTAEGHIETQAGQDADTGINVDVSGYFKDIDDGDKLTYSASGLPKGLEIDPDTGKITGTIDHSASQGGEGGVYTVVVTANDGNGGTATQTFTWDVTNPAPTAADDANATLQGGTAEGNVIAGDAAGAGKDVDPDGDTLKVQSVNGQDGNVGQVVAGDHGGTFTINADGSYTFNAGHDFDTLAEGKTATSSITYTVSDGEGGTSTATLTVTVTGANDAPTAEGHIQTQASQDADSGINVDVSGYFKDIDAGDKLTYSASGLPTGLMIDPDTGKITGTIDHSASQHQEAGLEKGVYTVTVTADDGHGGTVTQTFSWDVTNPAPTAANDVAATEQGGTASGNVITGDASGAGKDVDPDGDTLKVQSVNGQDGNVGQVVAGDHGGTFTINADGTYTFNAGHDFDSLAEGKTAVSSVTYTVTDSEGGISTATLAVTVTGTNDVPTAEGHIQTQVGQDADTGVNVDVSGYFKDIDVGDTLTYSASGLPKGLEIDPNTGKITGTIDHSASQGGEGGVYTVVVTANDGHGGTVTQTFNWDVTNPAPTAADDVNVTQQGGTATGNVITGDASGAGKDVDPDGDKLTVQSVKGDAGNVGQVIAGDHGGTFTINADGSYTFNAGHDFDTLAEGKTATSSITYTVTDGEGGTSTATLTVTVTGTNDVPTAEGHIETQVGQDADTGINVDVSGYFKDIDAGDTLTYSASGLPKGLEIDPATGKITGTIDHSASQGGESGVYTVVVTANDGHGGTITQTFNWDVTNPAPTAANDVNATQQGGTATGNVITGDAAGVGKDVDPDGDKLTVQSVNGQAANVGQVIAGDHGGSFTINADGTYTFNAGHDFDALAQGKTATSSITYTVTDNEGGTSTATLTVTVTGTNDAPTVDVINNQTGVDAGKVDFDTAGFFHDKDVGDTLTYSASGLPTGLTIDPATGKITGTIDHSASQHQEAGLDKGVYTVTVTANDGHGGTVTQTFSWDVTNPAPTAANDSNSTLQDGTATGNVITGDASGAGKDVDPDGDKLTVQSVNGQADKVGQVIAGDHGGSFTINADGSYTFNAGHDFDSLAEGKTATSSITYTVTDNEGGTSTATLTVTVTGTNDVPTAEGHIQTQVGQDADTGINVDVSGYFKDIDAGDTLTYSASGLPKGLEIDPNTGKITGTIDHSASQGGEGGVYTVVVTANDGHGGTVTQTFNWDVTNPAPTAANDVNATQQGGTATGNVITGDASGTGKDVDPDGDKLTVQSVNGQADKVGQVIAGDHGGSFTINADGTYTFNAGHDFDALAQGKTATSSITYTVTDNEGGISTATLTVTVTGTNDVPTAEGHIQTQVGQDADTGINVDVSGYFKDIDAGDTLTYSASGLPKGLEIDPNTGKITGTIDHSASQGGEGGVYTVVVTANDGHGGTVTQTFNWDVTNPAPTAANDVNSTSAAGTATGNVITGDASGAGKDVDPDGDTLVVKSVNGQDGNVGKTIAGDHGGTFTINADGTYTFNAGHDFDNLSNGTSQTTSISYTVSDGEGGTSTANLTVTITGTNHAPTVDVINDQTGVDAGKVDFSVASYFHDLDIGDKLTYSASGLPAGLTIDPATGKITGTLDHSASQHQEAGLDKGVYAVTVTADDGHGGTVTQTFNWDVTNPAPTAANDAAATQQGGSATGNVITGDASGAGKDVDPDGDKLTVQSVNGQAGNVGQVVAGDHGGTFTINADGTYTFNAGHDFDALAQGKTAVSSITYTVTDGEGGTSTATLAVTVTGTNDVPTAEGHIQTQVGQDADTGINVDVSGYFKDIDAGDTLTYSASGLPKGLEIDPNTGKITGTIDHSASQGGEGGVYTVVVTANDGHGGTVTQTFNWDVTNPAPTAANDVNATQQGGTATGNVITGDVNGAGKDVDPDGDKLTVQSVNGQAGNVGQVIAGDHGGSFTINADGTYTFNAGHDFDSLAQGKTATSSITYTVTDNEGGTSTATLIVIVTGTNDAPTVDVINNQTGVDAGKVDFDTAGFFHDKDVGDTLTYSASGLPTGLTIDPATGKITGTLDHSASQHQEAGLDKGVYTVTVTANDGHGGTVTQTFTWDVTNPAPTAANDVNSTSAAGTATGNVITGDSSGAGKDVDPDGDTLKVQSVNGQDANVGKTVAGDHGGTFTINADGTYTFNAGHDFDNLSNGTSQTTSVSYTVSDGEGGTSTANLTVTITGTNHAPTVDVINNQTGVDAGKVDFSVASYFHDQDVGDKLTYSASGLPTGLTIDPATGKITGTLDHSASQHQEAGLDKGVYTVTVTANDGLGGTVTQTFTWDVTNPAPTAANDVNATQQGGTASGNVITGDANGAGKDVDPDGDTLKVQSVNGHAGNVGQVIAGDHGGSFTINADGTYTFNAGHDFDSLAQGKTATSSITYTVTDNEGGTSTATLTVTVTGTNDVPTVDVINNQTGVDAGKVDFDTSGFFHDKDVGDTLTYSASGLPTGLAIDPATGKITGTLDHSASQHQEAGLDKGVYTVTVTANDGHGGTVTQTFTWDVTNPAPTAANDVNSATPTGTATGNVISGAAGGAGKDVDPDGDTLVVKSVNGQDANVGKTIAGDHGGTFTINADGTYTFNAGHDFDSLANGASQTTSINYTVSDGEGGTSKASLTVTVTGTNHAPTVDVINNQTGVDAGKVDFSVAGYFHDQDAGDKLTYSASGLPTGLTIDPATGKITGTLDHSASQHQEAGLDKGVYTVTVTANDGHGGTVTQTFTWDVTNPAPTAVNDANSTLQGGTAAGNVLTGDANGVGKDSDPDGDSIAVKSVNGVDANVGKTIAGDHGGTFVVNADGSYSFNAGHAFDHLGAGKTATTSINYTISDGEGGTSTATLTVTVTGTNDVPTITVGAGDSAAGVVYEDTASVYNGSLTIKDTDDGESLFQAQTVKDDYGTFTIDANGKWSYTLDNTNATVQALSGGDSLPVRTFTVVSEDGTATYNVNVTINGTNDAPVAADNSTTVAVGDTHTFTAAEFNFADTQGEHNTLQSVIISRVPTDGTLTLNGATVHAGDVISVDQINAGKLVYVPGADGGDASFGFKVVDNGGTDHGGQDTSGEYNFAIATNQLVVGGNDSGVINGGSGDDVIVGDLGGTKTVVVAGMSYNIALIIDHSGSMAWGLDGSQNPSSGQDRMSLVKAALINLLNTLDTHSGGVVNVALIGFGTNADSTIPIQGLTTANVDTLISKIQAMTATGGTNYEAAFDSAVSWFNAQTAAGKTGANYENVTYFLTDGDPTYYLKSSGGVGGTGNTTDVTTVQHSVDAFAALSNVSEVHAVGIGDDVDSQILQFFDNTAAGGTSSATIGIGSNTASTLANFNNRGSGSSGGMNDVSNWTQSLGGSGSSISKSNQQFHITDANGSGATTVTSQSFTIGDKTSVSFDVSTSNFNTGDTFKWTIEKLVNGHWEVAQTGTSTSAISSLVTMESNVLGAGTYHLVYSVTDNSSGSGSSTVNIDNITTHAYSSTVTAPAGTVDIVHQASDLDAVLQGGSSHQDPLSVGSDTINGGDGNDIIFGDTINTDALSWAGHAAGTHDGAGYQGLVDYLTATNGHAATTAEVYDYIAQHSADFNVVGDPLGSNDVIHGGAGDDIIYGGGGNDDLYGDDGNDIIYATSGNNTLHGGAGNDTLYAGTGADTLIGGQGNDTLVGGGGGDTFKWELHDQGTTSNPAVDTVKQFSTADVGSGGDVLDLAGLLQNPADGDLSKYLHFTKDGSNTVIQVSTQGQVATGFDQKIVLENVDLIGSHTTDQQVITDLLQKGKLHTHD
ncbi:Ig-like domain-containing protein [Bordetella genomosp. 10]|uniref:Ig-like domain-containing protein n=1 Tax=Bordetella genomosp. 10 TaxID=1416804 RepID=UPI000B9E6995|nr:putative Ig domain-containing protein [Bordetella genomosp. 10]